MKKYEKAKIEFITLNVAEDVLTASGEYTILLDGSIDGAMDPVN